MGQLRLFVQALMATDVIRSVRYPDMKTIKAKVIDSFHLELKKEILTKTGAEVFIRIIEKKPIASLSGAWGYDVDSADFVDTLRSTKRKTGP